MIIIGIDPGSIITGYGVIDYHDNTFNLIEYGVVKAAIRHDDIPRRLKEIFLRLEQVILRSKPDVAAFETVFYAKNVQSIMKLSQARGVAILAITLSDIPVYEYSPREIKKSVTGRGNALKEQVQFMVKNLLSINETPEFYDATDALGIAICHALRQGASKSSSGSWKDFIKENPGLVINP